MATKTDKIQDDRGSVTINALLMAFGTMSSRVLGLVRDLLFASMFSLEVKDAWTAAFRLPNLFRRILGEGSLSVSFIPVFVQTRVEDPSLVRSQNLVNSFYTMLLLVLTLLTALGTFYPQVLLNAVLDPSYIADVPKYEMTLRMSKIMFCFIFFMSTYAFFMGILNALGKYALAAVAPTLFNVAMIIANFVPTKWLAFEGDAIAWGVVVGGFLQMALLVPALIKHNYLPKLNFDFWNKDSLHILKNMVPGLLGLGLSQITTIVNLKFASSLHEGSISYIYFADRLLELPLSLVSVSLGVALLPTLAKMWAENDKQKMLETASHYLRLNLFISIPAAIGLFVLAQPIVQLLFERGKFTPTDTEITSQVVQIYSMTLIILSCVRVLVPSFYAIKNTWAPALVSALCLVVHVIVAPLLMQWWGLNGLVSSTLLSSGLNLAMLVIFYYKYIGDFQMKPLLISVGKFTLAGACMWGILAQYPSFIELFGYGFFAHLFSLAFAILFGMGSYFMVSYFLQVPELKESLGTIWMKVKRRF